MALNNQLVFDSSCYLVDRWLEDRSTQLSAMAPSGVLVVSLQVNKFHQLPYIRGCYSQSQLCLRWSTHILWKGGVAVHSSLYFRKCARSQWSTVEIQPSQWLKPRKSAWSTVKTPKRVGQNFDLAVTAVTIESMGVTSTCTWSMTLHH